VLTIYELYAGMKEKEREATDDFIGACLIEPVSRETAARGGEWRAIYREKGITLTAIDCLIASTALLQGHKIATRNARHYPDKKLLLTLP
jgi:predicted nucleic acid-binding protein